MRILKTWSFVLIFFGGALIASTSGLCTFPEVLRGSWMTSHAGLVNFTDNHIRGHDLHPIPRTIDFQCETYNKTLNKYFLKSTTELPVFSLTLILYMCLELHQVTNTKFWYHLGSRAVEEGLAEATCPQDILRTFSNGTLTNAAGDVKCSSDGFDVCSDPTYKTRMNVTYSSSCDTSLKLADGGVSICLLDKLNETTGVRYLHVWNNDTALKSGVRRINCYAYSVSADGLNATIYPEACHEGQTDTYVKTRGVKLRYDVIAASCPDTSYPGSQIAYYVAIIGGALGLILITVLIVCLIKKTRCRCCACVNNKSRVGQSETSLSSYMSSVESGEEDMTSSAKNRQTQLTTHGEAPDGKKGEDTLENLDESKTKSKRRRAKRKGVKANDIWVAKKPIKLGPIVEPYLMIPPKVELLYMVEPRPTTARTFFNQRALFASRASIRHSEDPRPENTDVGSK